MTWHLVKTHNGTHTPTKKDSGSTESLGQHGVQ